MFSFGVPASRCPNKGGLKQKMSICTRKHIFDGGVFVCFSYDCPEIRSVPLHWCVTLVKIQPFHLMRSGMESLCKLFSLSLADISFHVDVVCLFLQMCACAWMSVCLVNGSWVHVL